MARNKGPGFRHELKYEIDQGTYLALRQRLRPVMKPDPHAGSEGSYTIRSVYFDNVNDKALREKIDGVQKREKFRIRYYNDDFSFFTLEKKQKIGSLCLKYDATITEDECRKILSGNLDWMVEHSAGLVRELYCKMRHQCIRPRVLVSYIREPYIYGAGNVRVTFDTKVRSTLWHRNFLEPGIRDIGVLDEPSRIIMEVKFDAFLPEVIQMLIQSEGIRQEAFSKYGACRRFG